MSTTTSVRNKSKRSNATGTNKKTELLECVEIHVEYLRKGDRIVTSFYKDDDILKGALKLTEKQETSAVNGVLQGKRFAKKTHVVKEFDECPQKWRTHVHVNKTECHDMRQKVWIVK